MRSLLYASIATVLCVLLGYPLAYAIAFKAGRCKNLLLVAVIAPFFTSFLVRTLSWQYILGDNGSLVGLPADAAPARPGRPAAGDAVRRGHRPDLQLPAVHGPAALRVAGEDRPPADRGRPATSTPSPITTFRTVTLPLSMPGLVAGTLLTFIPAAGDYINAELLGNPHTRMVGNEIQDLFRAGDYPTAAALSVTLMAAIVAAGLRSTYAAPARRSCV